MHSIPVPVAPITIPQLGPTARNHIILRLSAPFLGDGQRVNATGLFGTTLNNLARHAWPKGKAPI